MALSGQLLGRTLASLVDIVGSCLHAAQRKSSRAEGLRVACVRVSLVLVLPLVDVHQGPVLRVGSLPQQGQLDGSPWLTPEREFKIPFS